MATDWLWSAMHKKFLWPLQCQTKYHNCELQACLEPYHSLQLHTLAWPLCFHATTSSPLISVLIDSSVWLSLLNPGSRITLWMLVLGQPLWLQGIAWTLTCRQHPHTQPQAGSSGAKLFICLRTRPGPNFRPFYETPGSGGSRVQTFPSRTLNQFHTYLLRLWDLPWRPRLQVGLCGLRLKVCPTVFWFQVHPCTWLTAFCILKL